MTDNEIIKALECCRMPVGSGSCNDCPFDSQREKRLTTSDKSCTTLMFDYALDLINRQKAEIEGLKRDKTEEFKKLVETVAERITSKIVKIENPIGRKIAEKMVLETLVDLAEEIAMEGEDNA
jgi:hypothetical protein